MARPTLIDPMEANYGLQCMTCADNEEEDASRMDRDADEAVGDLSGGGGGCNLTRRQATSRAAAHLKKNPTHEISWTAMGSARRA